MLTILAAEENSGFFTPSIRKTEKNGVGIIYIKNKNSLKKLKKMGLTQAAAAPSAAALTGAAVYRLGGGKFLPLLPKILSGMAALPVDELFVAAESTEAAEIIEICADCARLFTVISREEGRPEVFDKLYFNKGIILRRIASPHSRIGRTALCICGSGRAPCGVRSVRLDSLGRLRVSGGRLDFLKDEVGIVPTIELYALAEIPVTGKIGPEYGDEIFYLDIGGIM